MNSKELVDKNIISVVRRIYPELIANEIVNTQPMNHTWEEIFTLKPEFRANPSRCYE